MGRWLSLLAAVVAVVAMLMLRPQQSYDDMGTGTMFDRIATRYDGTNRVLSLGMDSGWRRVMVDALALTASDRVLDLATGTADVAILEGASGATVLGIDPSEQMLEVGRGKVRAAGLDEFVVLKRGDATGLALANATFDKLSIAFGIRNIPDVAAALGEMRRLAAPGATLAILEFCEPVDGPLAPVARLFIRHVVPFLGAMFSGAHWDEYRHLQTSIAKFPPPPQFAAMIADAGFTVDATTFLAFGSVALYIANVPP